MAKSFVIIGPSKVGKTALISCLQHAVLSRDSSLDNSDFDVVAQNENTNKLFSSAMRLIVDGDLPFAGTASVIDYEFLFEVSHQASWAKEIIYNLFQVSNAEKALIQFPDAPGGALFEGDDEEVDYVLMRQYRNRLVKLIKEADGLIICVDASALNSSKTGNEQLQVAFDFARWIPNLFNEVLQGTDTSKTKLKRVCVVLTKADKWALQEGKRLDAETAVKAVDSYQHAKKLLGNIFLNTLRRRLKPDTEVGFCMSSVFGFLDGAPNAVFLSEQKRKNRNTAPQIDPNQWVPYNAIEPFVFLLTGENVLNQFTIKKASELKN